MHGIFYSSKKIVKTTIHRSGYRFVEFNVQKRMMI